MRERIQSILKEKNISAAKFAEMLEVQPSSISHLISGRNNPNFEFVVKVLNKFPEINPDWFILGEGEMFRGLSVPLDSEKRLPLTMFADKPSKSVSETPVASSGIQQTTEKKLERIILLYSDQTFSVYEG